MKKFVPFIVLSLFVILLLSLCGPILTKRQQEEAQRAYEAERHLVVFSDLPQDVNDGLAQLFYEQKHLRVQIYSKSDGDIRQALKTDSGVKPDILIASEDNLREQKKNGILQPYASPVTDKVLPSMKDPEQLWNGLWYNPMVFIVSQSYYERAGHADPHLGRPPDGSRNGPGLPGPGVYGHGWRISLFFRRNERH